jgi:UDP-N-acetylmuramoylalanine--D-glutamate ligase
MQRSKAGAKVGSGIRAAKPVQLEPNQIAQNQLADNQIVHEHPPTRPQMGGAAPPVRELLPMAETRLTVVRTNGFYSNMKLAGKAMIEEAFAGQKVVILGLARQGLALARFFASIGAQVVVSDLASAEKLQSEIAALEKLPVELVLGSHPLSLLNDCALLCLSGGVPPQHPLVQAALTQNIPLSNDSLLTFQLAQSMGLGPLIGITGSSGKTTTTTLVGNILSAQGLNTHVGGNIGTPLIDRIDTIQPHEPLVLELSSFQLELFDPTMAWGPLEHVGPDIATITNLTPNHLDRHANMAAYADAKLNLLRQMKSGSTLVVNIDDPVTSRLAPPVKGTKRRKLPADWKLEDMLAETRAALEEQGVRIVPVSRQVELEQGAWVEGNALVIDGQPICSRDEVQLRGDHNISNLLTACAVAHAAGAELSAMGETARTFHGVAHRLEVVATVGGVTWINDSIATSPERAIAAMRSFDPAKQTIILLAGGKDKNLPWDTFASEAVSRVNFLIGFGQSGPMIVRTVQDRARFLQQKAPNCAVVQRLDEAVELAARVASPNSVVLLSPGGTSFDAYQDFEERGEHFRQLVRRTNQQRVISETHVGTNAS